MKSEWIKFLEDVTEEDKDKIGGKAWSVARLKQAGFNVPQGFVITTAAFHHHVTSLLKQETSSEDDFNNENLENDIVFDEEFMDSIKQALEKLNAEFVAVRSSAVEEDLEEASFAGQYETFLGLRTLEQIIKALKSTWASYFSQRARHYRQRYQEFNKLNRGGMAVLIQQQVNADVSGVLFTVNPLTGRDEECLLEAAYGLGEGVVSGHVSPDRFVANIFHGKIQQREINKKTRMVVLDTTQSGTKIVSVPVELQDQPCLNDDQVLQLLKLGLKIQLHYGKPQDIEWAMKDGIPYVLQSRSLTKITFAPDFGQWTTANLREVHPPEGLTPFSREIFSDPFRWGMQAVMIDIKLLKETEPVPEWCTEYFGRCYWNVGMAKELASRIPGYNERVFDESAGIEIYYEGDGKTTPWTLPNIVRALPVLFALNKQYKEYAEFARKHVQTFDERLKPFSSISDKELRVLPQEEFYQKFLQLLEFTLETDEIAMHVSFIGALALDDFKEKMHGINKRLPPEQRIDEGKLLTGLTGISTSDVLLDLWKLLRIIAKNHAAREILRKNDPKEALHLLAREESTKEIANHVTAFIDKYRFIAAYDEELSCPRWHDHPWEAIALLQQHLNNDSHLIVDPQEILRTQHEERVQEETRSFKLLSRGLSGKLLGWYKRKSFEKVLRNVQAYTILREATRLPVSKVFFHLRRYTLELGRRWKELGYLDSEEDIFYLTYYTVKRMMVKPFPPMFLREEIEYHKKKRASFRNFNPPLTITGAVTMDASSRLTTTTDTNDNVIQGVGCSSGIAEGPVRIILSLEDGHQLKQGDILVTKFTNPGWTPLFSLANGVIIEEGGLLSHTAVVAREVGIPAVLQVRDATKLLKNGQKVRIDGFKGLVKILE